METSERLNCTTNVRFPSKASSSADVPSQTSIWITLGLWDRLFHQAALTFDLSPFVHLVVMMSSRPAVWVLQAGLIKFCSSSLVPVVKRRHIIRDGPNHNVLLQVRG